MNHRERIVCQSPDGAIVVINPVEPIRVPESVEAWLDRIADHALAVDPELAGYVRVATLDVGDFPSRRLRGAWKHNGGKIEIDRKIAVSMLLAEVRAVRDSALNESDRERMKLEDVGTAEEKKALADYRQSLRNLPAVVAAELSTMTVAQMESYKPSLPVTEKLPMT